MSIYYQKLDAPHFDYDMQLVPGITDLHFRGPIPERKTPYMACFGGAQTMGRFVHEPYARTLSQNLSLPCLNISIGGAGPRFALKPEVLQLLQGAELVIVQVPSGRSASCSLFDNSRGGRNDGICTRTGKHMSSDQLVGELVKNSEQDLLERYVRETREDYCRGMQELGRTLSPPTILMWFSMREFDYEINWDQAPGIGGAYPQLVVGSMIQSILPEFDSFVNCTSSAGIPQKLWRGDRVDGSRRDDSGQLWNHYYPSPAMHTQATQLLLPECRKLLANTRP